MSLAPTHNLPDAVSSFVGRDREISELEALLAHSRLLTLVGAGGIGKTRLALALAARAASNYPGGVSLVQLAPVAHGSLLHQAVASALNVREQPGRPLLATLVDAIGQRRALIILDNCEHLVMDCALFAEQLLHRCPGLSILATSREPLGLGGEITWRVPSLAVPEPHGTAEKLLESEAVRLFIDRAVAVQPGFRLTDQSAPVVAELCRRVDGIALAIELAAAWLRVLSPDQILVRLNDALQLLVGGSRTAPPRHQALRATIEWSYGLLTDQERRFFHRLGAFASGWTLEAAEGICAGDKIGVQDVLPLLTRLIDKSLVVVEHRDATAHVRYRMLELLRAYSLERAADSGELSGLQRRHGDWYLAQAERAPPELLSPPHIEELVRESDNLRAALRWTIRTGDAAKGWRLAATMWQVWYVRGYYTEGRSWLAELLALPDGPTPVAGRARALAMAGHLAYCQGEYPAAEGLLDQATVAADAVSDDQTIAIVLQFQGNLARARGDLARARQMYGSAHQLNHRLESPVWEAMSLVGEGQAAADQGQHDVAERFATESLALCKQVGHRWGAARSLWILGRVASDRGEFDQAQELLQECMSYQHDIGDRQGSVWAALDLAHNAASAGDVATAIDCLTSGLGLARELGDRLSIARAIEGIATLVAHQRPTAAVRLAAAASAVRAKIGATHARVPQATLDAAMVTARRTLNSNAYQAAWASGSALAFDQAVEEAQQLLHEVRETRAEVRPREAAAKPLTGREREVAMLVARGCTDKQIAERLVITEGTAGVHVGHVLAKLGFHSRAQIAAWVVEHGLQPRVG